MTVSANATATLTQYAYPKGSTQTIKTQTVRGTVAISSGSYPPGGFTLNWGLLNVNSLAPVHPSDVDFKSIGNPPSGAVYCWDSVNDKLRILLVGPTGSTVSGPLVEFYSFGDIPGWVINDVIEFTADFVRG